MKKKNYSNVELVAMAESFGWQHYCGHNPTIQEKINSKWWNHEDPSELVELETIKNYLGENKL